MSAYKLYNAIYEQIRKLGLSYEIKEQTPSTTLIIKTESLGSTLVGHLMDPVIETGGLQELLKKLQLIPSYQISNFFDQPHLL